MDNRELREIILAVGGLVLINMLPRPLFDEIFVLLCFVGVPSFISQLHSVLWDVYLAVLDPLNLFFFVWIVYLYIRFAIRTFSKRPDGTSRHV